jgi:hypothetical protein
MRRIRDGIWVYRDYDVFYSPDESGYYAQQDNKTSRIYKSLDGVKKAIDGGKIKIK